VSQSHPGDSQRHPALVARSRSELLRSLERTCLNKRRWWQPCRNISPRRHSAAAGFGRRPGRWRWCRCPKRRRQSDRMDACQWSSACWWGLADQLQTTGLGEDGGIITLCVGPWSSYAFSNHLAASQHSYPRRELEITGQRWIMTDWFSLSSRGDGSDSDLERASANSKFRPSASIGAAELMTALGRCRKRSYRFPVSRLGE